MKALPSARNGGMLLWASVASSAVFVLTVTAGVAFWVVTPVVPLAVEPVTS